MFSQDNFPWVNLFVIECWYMKEQWCFVNILIIKMLVVYVKLI